MIDEVDLIFSYQTWDEPGFGVSTGIVANF
jgi:hypothetical protein